MIHVPHQFTERLTNWVLGKVAPARPEDIISGKEFKELESEAKRSQRLQVLVGLPLGALVSGGAAFMLHMLSFHGDAPAANPVYDTRWWFPWIAPAVCGVLGTAVLAEYLYLTRVNRPLGDKLRRYGATKNRWDPRRGSFLTAGFAMCLAVALTFLVLSLSVTIDERGIRLGSGPLGRGLIPFSDVGGIGLYDQLTAPVGVRDVFNLEIRFNERTPFRRTSNKGCDRPEVLERIAAFVSERSGVPVARQQRRPE